MVSAQPSQAPGMLAVGLAENRFSNSFARRSRRGSPRSSASNSSSTHAPDSLPIRARKFESKRELAPVYNPYPYGHQPLLRNITLRKSDLCITGCAEGSSKENSEGNCEGNSKY